MTIFIRYFSVWLVLSFVATATFGQANQTARSFHSSCINWWKKGEYDKAIEAITSAIKLDPDNATYFNNRGVLWATKGDDDKAIADYNKAIKLNPKHVTAHISRARAWERKGADGKALADYEAVIGFGWHASAVGYIARGNYWEKNGKYDKAIADYSKAIAKYPMIRGETTSQTLARAYTDRGDTWRKKGNYDKAVEDYSEAIKFDPKYSLAYKGYSWLRATCSDDEWRNGRQAVELARKSCELTKWNDHESICTLAAAYAEAGEFENAIRWLRKAIEQNPNSEKTMRQKMMQLYESGRPYRSK